MIMPVQTRTRQPVRQRGNVRRPNLVLKARRIEKGWDRKDLSHLTGVSIETIRLAELGFVPASMRIQSALAQTLDVEILDLWPIEVQR